ncbi:MAG: glycosyltransferase family 9 protein [Bacteroidota bacterium]
MNIGTMRFVDRFVGVPLCWILGTAYKLGSPSKAALSPRVRRILVMKFFGLGSILLSTPALLLMESAFPDATITFLSFDRNRDLLRRFPSIDSVLTVRRTSITNFLSDSFRLILHLVTVRYDVVFDLEFFSKFSTFLAGLSRARIRAAFSLPTYWRSSLVTHSIPLARDRHVTESFSSLVFAVTGSPMSIPAVQPPAVYEADSQSLLKKIPLDDGPVIGVNVNAGDTFLERRWPPERFAALVSALSREHGSVFVFTGISEERSYVQHVIDMSGCRNRCINSAGDLSMPELGALLRHCSLVISNDSGTLHLASALGTPTIGLYGPESPEFYGTTGNGSSILYSGISCSPCMNIYSAKSFRCPYDSRCMKQIPLADVLELAQHEALVH